MQICEVITDVLRNATQLQGAELILFSSRVSTNSSKKSANKVNKGCCSCYCVGRACSGMCDVYTEQRRIVSVTRALLMVLICVVEKFYDFQE